MLVKRRIVIITLCLFMLIALGCEDLRKTERDEYEDRVGQEFSDATGIDINFSRTNIEYRKHDFCEGTQVAASMLLSEAGMDPDLNSYGTVEFAELYDREGNKYPIVIVNGNIVIPDRYKIK